MLPTAMVEVLEETSDPRGPAYGRTWSPVATLPVLARKLDTAALYRRGREVSTIGYMLLADPTPAGAAPADEMRHRIRMDGADYTITSAVSAVPFESIATIEIERMA